MPWKAGDDPDLHVAKTKKRAYYTERQEEDRKINKEEVRRDDSLVGF